VGKSNLARHHYKLSPVLGKVRGKWGKKGLARGRLIRTNIPVRRGSDFIPNLVAEVGFWVKRKIHALGKKKGLTQKRGGGDS